MATHRQLLIAPEPEALAAAVYEVTAAVNADLGSSLRLVVTPEDVNHLRGRMHQHRDGSFERTLPAQGWRYSRMAAVAVVWWSDHLQRQHTLVSGAAAEYTPGLRLETPNPERPALACIYPESCLIISQHRRHRLVVVCRCGAWGEPAALAWMGNCCGPCADRSEHEAADIFGWRVNGPLLRLALGPGGEEVGCQVGTSTVQVRNLLTGTIREEWICDAVIDDLSLSSDGRFYIVSLPQERQVRLHQRPHTHPQIWHDTFDLPCAITPDNRRMAIYSHQEGQMVLRDIDSEPPIPWPHHYLANDQYIPGPAEQDIHMGYLLELQALAVSPDGRTLAGAAPDGVYFWDLFTRRPRNRLTLPSCRGPLVFSPDGGKLAVGLTGAQTQLALLDLGKLRSIGVIGGTQVITDFTFTPDGEWLITCEGDAVRVWETRTGLERRAIALVGERRVRSLRCTPEGLFAVVAFAPDEVRLWPSEVLRPD